MSADHAEMRKRAEQWIRACEMVKDPGSAVHARDVLRLLDERDAAEKRLAALEQASKVFGQVDAMVATAAWKVRAEEAEKRLADLRAWAEAQSFGPGDDPVLRYLDVFSRVVARIDGKETP